MKKQDILQCRFQAKMKKKSGNYHKTNRSFRFQLLTKAVEKYLTTLLGALNVSP